MTKRAQQTILLFTLSFVYLLWIPLNGATQSQDPLNPKDSPPISSFFTTQIQPLDYPATDMRFRTTIPYLETQHAQIFIHQDAMEKEFLLQTATIGQGHAPFGGGLKSRIVTFRKQNNFVYMLEATPEHTISTDYAATLLITRFPILQDQGQLYLIDFNQGMSDLFIGGDWTGYQEDGAEYEAQFSAKKVRMSYLAEAKTVEQNHLYIQQMVQLDLPDSETFKHPTYEVRYYLSLYQANPAFKPMQQPYPRHFGYFESSPIVNRDGGAIGHVSKFDTSKPIKFYLSANTPADYVEAVKDGILYWNRAFAKPIIQAEIAPAGIQAPSPLYNIIQWIPFDTAGFAYADAQTDPRTGEIKHAQVFLTSSFAILGRQAAQTALRNLATADQTARQSNFVLSMTGFTQRPLCNYNFQDQLRDTLTTLLTSGADDQVILKASQDVIRQVVAHEVGHTLGLRHNFAGSLAANFPLASRADIIADYLKKGLLNGDVVVSSSVMDYLRMDEDMLIGHQIHHHQAMFSYDHLAIQVLYENKKGDFTDAPLFCTDDHVSTYSDCNRFDSGPSPIEYGFWQKEDSIKQLPDRLLGGFIYHKLHDKSENGVPLNRLQFTPSKLAKRLLQFHQTIMPYFYADTQLLQIRSTFSSIGEVNAEEVRQAELAWASQEMEKWEGKKHLLDLFGPELATSLPAKFNQQLDQLVAFDAEGNDLFSAAEKETMKATVAKLALHLDAAIAEADLTSLPGAPIAPGTPAYKTHLVVDHPLSDILAAVYVNRMENTLFTYLPGQEFTVEIDRIATPAELVSLIETTTPAAPTEPAIEPTPEATPAAEVISTLPKTVTFTTYKYPIKTRTSAASLFKKTRAQAPEWGKYPVWLMKDRFNKAVAETLTFPLKSVNPIVLPAKAARWVFEAEAVLSSF